MRSALRFACVFNPARVLDSLRLLHATIRNTWEILLGILVTGSMHGIVRIFACCFWLFLRGLGLQIARKPLMKRRLQLFGLVWRYSSSLR